MRRNNTTSGDLPSVGGLPHHRMGSPPPRQSVSPGSSGMPSPEPHLLQSPPQSFSPQQQTHPALQQFLMGTGINIGNLQGQPILHTRLSPTAVSPGVLPITAGTTSPMGYQQQLSPQAMSRQMHPSTQALLQMSCLNQALATPGANPLPRPGRNVPTLSTARSFVDQGLPIQQVAINPTSSVQQQTSNNPFVFTDDRKPPTQESLLVQNLLMPSHQPMGTIHHLGQGSQGRSSSSSPRRSSSHSPTRGAPGHKSPTGGVYRRPHSPARTSPLPSSPSLVMRKTTMPQTEERPPANAEVAELRRQVLQQRLTDLKKLKDSYNDKLTELFFLQHGGNMMDFHVWKKRPNQQLFVYLSSQQMDDEEEKTINDEVKVITNSGSNIPVGTPVAISTQLPPAVSALSSQLNQKAREQKAREMRRSFPGSVQAAAVAAGSAAAAGGGDVDVSRKRSLSQAGLDSPSGAQEKKLQLMHSTSHEPNVTVTPSMMSTIPSLPGTKDALSKSQPQPSPQQQKPPKEVSASTPSRLPGSLAVPTSTQPAKSPPATHSMHQLKLPSPASSTPTSSTTATPTVARKIPSLSVGTPTVAGGATTPSPNRTPKAVPTPLSPTAQQRLATRQQSLSAVYDYTIGSQEMIVEKAKQEAQVMQRIAELRKEGLWAAKRLPKVQEPPRQKTQWDYLLEEMQWLATDFAQERRWKRASARKLVRAVARHHQEQHAKEVKAEKEESQKLVKIAGNIAKEIMTFWTNIEKVVQYKQQSRLEERRKRVMDLQLDYIVGQTEKYSSWLTEGLNIATSSTTTSVQGSPSSLRSDADSSVITGDDVDFQPVGDDTDDEETIDVEEEADGADAEAQAKEIELLQKESELPLEDLLSSLPPGILDKPGSSSEGGGSKDESSSDDRSRRKKEEDTVLKAVTEDVKEESDSKTDDAEFELSADEEEEAQDEEETLEEQEANEGAVDHEAEVAALEAEGDLPIEELMKRYAGAYEDEYEYPHSEESDLEEESMEETESEEEEEQGTDEEEEELTDIGMEYLINPEKTPEDPKKSKQSSKGEPNTEITDIAATAQSLQPTGYTLSTTQVQTKVPFLLRHKLREYQHIGLDWMVTLHAKKLNGILADEMGLGKTIQTIALFAHLACEDENWGPHLIVVPTSVMLNWEMELKKWCPGFKILTYYGNQKERKLKRQGWTKCNAFHVCITSYKLVIQDHQSFRRKKWKYLVLDEAQNIKNFKSQRWQTLLNFNSQRRLLLTGTPLQNNLMELWSLMHFLMPHVFASHREFREWFSNPLSGMIEGTQEYNEGLIRRLHKVLRPFLLRRLKSEVEKQMPKKYEHVVRCRLSKRQRYLYEDFMSRAKTRETLATGHFMSVINVLMQLRKVCNHPDLFEPRPIFSPFQMEGINFYTASLALRALEYDPFKHVNLNALNFCIADIESFLPAYAAHRIRKLQTPRKLIEEIDSSADPPPVLPKLKVKPGKLFTPVPTAIQVKPKEARAASPLIMSSGRASPMQQGSSSPVLIRTQQSAGGRASPVVTQFLVRSPSGGTQILRQTETPPGTPVSGLATLQLTGTSTPGTFTLVSTQSPAAIPGATPLQQLPGYTGSTTSTSNTATSLASVVQQRLVLQQQIGAVSGSPNRAQILTQPITLQMQNRGQQAGRIAIPASQLQLQSQSGSIVRIVQTPSGQQLVRQAPQASNVISQQALLQQQLQLQRQQQQRQAQQQQVTLQSAGGQQVTVNSQQLVNSVMSQARTQVGQPVQNNIATANSAVAAPQLTTQIQQPQLSAVAQVQNALQQQQQQQQQFLQQLQQQQQQQIKLQQPAQAAHSSAARVVSMSPGLAQTIVSSSAPSVTATTAMTSANRQVESKVKQTIPKLQTATTSGARTTTTPSKTYSTAAAWKAKREAAKKSPFYLEPVTARRDEDRKSTLSRIASVNQKRCSAKPVYGQDLFSAVSIYSGAPPACGSNPLASGIGHVFAQCVHRFGDGGKSHYQYTHALKQVIHSPEDRLEELREIIKRYAIVVPVAEAPPISLHTSHPPPSFLVNQRRMVAALNTALKPRMKCLHDLRMAAKLQFPELRLIQYDCGKLQALSVLLHKLKVGGHRVLIFTQMTKMLDVLERFLNYYGFIYLRLDGTTRVEMRQVLMERFNADPRIFVFILSTRSGGVGVNLTGADTVIFYDSDWNPTMDAQAQDRCHRIGQTRDVHIYRLVSEMTVEENILKKANQKRLLVDVSIEGGNFTTAFFRERTIKDLFDMSTTGNMSHASELVVEDLKAAATPADTPPQTTEPAKAKGPNLTKEQLEQALARTEDETDVQAASKAHAEQDAELAEFDEDIPYEGEEGKKKEDEPSKVEIELAQLDEQLTPIEKYAMKFLECTLEPIAMEELKEAEEQIEEAKKEWELSRLKAIKEEEERRAEMEEDEILYTYTSEDAQNKVHKNKQAKSKQNRASSRANKMQRSSVEKRPTRGAEPRSSTRTTRSSASSPIGSPNPSSSPVLRSRTASPEGPRITSPFRSGPGSPTRAKMASPERSITLRSDRGRVRSSDESVTSPPASPPWTPPVSSTLSGGTRSRRVSSSSAASETMISKSVSSIAKPASITIPTHGWTTRSKRKSIDLDGFEDIREVEKRARAVAAEKAAAKNSSASTKKPAQGDKPQTENKDSFVQVKSPNHEDSAESILQNIEKLTATIENELRNENENNAVANNQIEAASILSKLGPTLVATSSLQPVTSGAHAITTTMPSLAETIKMNSNSLGLKLFPSGNGEAERPRTPIFEKIQSESPTSSPKNPASPKMPETEETNVFERMKLAAAGNPVVQVTSRDYKSMQKPSKERKGLFEKMKAAFALRKAKQLAKKPVETSNIVEDGAISESTLESNESSSKSESKTVSLSEKEPDKVVPDKSRLEIDNQEPESIKLQQTSRLKSDEVLDVVSINSLDTKPASVETNSVKSIGLEGKEPKNPDHENTSATDNKVIPVDRITDTVVKQDTATTSLLKGEQLQNLKCEMISESSKVHTANQDAEKHSDTKGDEVPMEVEPVTSESSQHQNTPLEVRIPSEVNSRSSITSPDACHTFISTRSKSPSPDRPCSPVLTVPIASSLLTASPTPDNRLSPRFLSPPSSSEKSPAIKMHEQIAQKLGIPLDQEDVEREIGDINKKDDSQQSEVQRSSIDETIEVDEAKNSAENEPEKETLAQKEDVISLHIDGVKAVESEPKENKSCVENDEVTSTNSKIEKVESGQSQKDLLDKSVATNVEQRNVADTQSTSGEQSVATNVENLQEKADENKSADNVNSVICSEKSNNGEEKTPADKDEVNTTEQKNIELLKIVESRKEEPIGIDIDESKMEKQLPVIPECIPKETERKSQPIVESPKDVEPVKTVELEKSDGKAELTEKNVSETKVIQIENESVSSKLAHKEKENIEDGPSENVTVCPPENIEQSETSINAETPLHLDIDNRPAPSLVKQSPGTVNVSREDELEMPKISPVLKVSDKTRVSVTALSASVKKVPSSSELEELPKPSGKKQEEVSDTKKDDSTEHENKMNHVDNDTKSDESEGGSSESDEDDEDDDAPRTTRAKAALLKARERRQLRSGGRGALLQPLPYKPTLAKGKVLGHRSPIRRLSGSQGNSPHSDSSPPPRKRPRPQERNSNSPSNSDTSPQRGRPRKYPKSEDDSAKDKSHAKSNKAKDISKPKTHKENKESNSDSSPVRTMRSKLRNSSTSDLPKSSQTETKMQNRTRTKSVASNSAHLAELELGARTTRSRHNSSATSCTSSRNSSAANSRDASPARTSDGSTVNRQRRISERRKSLKS